MKTQQIHTTNISFGAPQKISTTTSPVKERPHGLRHSHGSSVPADTIDLNDVLITSSIIPKDKRSNSLLPNVSCHGNSYYEYVVISLFIGSQNKCVTENK